MRLRIDRFDIAHFATWNSQQDREDWFRAFVPKGAEFEIEPYADTSGNLLHIDAVFANTADGKEFQARIEHSFGISASEVHDKEFA